MRIKNETVGSAKTQEGLSALIRNKTIYESLVEAHRAEIIRLEQIIFRLEHAYKKIQSIKNELDNSVLGFKMLNLGKYNESPYIWKGDNYNKVDICMCNVIKGDYLKYGFCYGDILAEINTVKEEYEIRLIEEQRQLGGVNKKLNTLVENIKNFWE